MQLLDLGGLHFLDGRGGSRPSWGGGQRTDRGFFQKW